MKNLFAKKQKFNLFIITFLMLSLAVSSVHAQKYHAESFSTLEELEDKKMDYLKQIDKIAKNYPAFSYSYVIEDGEVQDVAVTGVERDIDRKKLEVVLFDLKSSDNMLKNKANRVGVFYSVDKPAKYEEGRDELQREIRSNLKYPEDAKNWGVEGTVFVKFVIDENGEIPFATAASNIETSRESYLKDLEEQAVKAVKATAGEWEPGKVEGVNVSSLAVVPITFDFQKHPSIPALIR